MADHYENVANRIQSIIQNSRKDVITLTNQQIISIYGKSNFPRSEARTRIMNSLFEKYGLRIAFSESNDQKVTCVFKDHVFEPVQLP